MKENLPLPPPLCMQVMGFIRLRVDQHIAATFAWLNTSPHRHPLDLASTPSRFPLNTTTSPHRRGSRHRRGGGYVTTTVVLVVVPVVVVWWSPPPSSLSSRRWSCIPLKPLTRGTRKMQSYFSCSTGAPSESHSCGSMALV